MKMKTHRNVMMDNPVSFWPITNQEIAAYQAHAPPNEDRLVEQQVTELHIHQIIPE